MFYRKKQDLDRCLGKLRPSFLRRVNVMVKVEPTEV
jgi:hypothetical protein